MSERVIYIRRCTVRITMSSHPPLILSDSCQNLRWRAAQPTVLTSAGRRFLILSPPIITPILVAPCRFGGAMLTRPVGVATLLWVPRETAEEVVVMRGVRQIGILSKSGPQGGRGGSAPSVYIFNLQPITLSYCPERPNCMYEWCVHIYLMGNKYIKKARSWSFIQSVSSIHSAWNITINHCNTTSGHNWRQLMGYQFSLKIFTP